MPGYLHAAYSTSLATCTTCAQPARLCRAWVSAVALARAAAILGGKSRSIHDPRPARYLCLDIGQELRSGFAGDLVALGLELAAHAGVGVGRFRRVSEASNDVGW